LSKPTLSVLEWMFLETLQATSSYISDKPHPSI
jgi:hypothetical protein